MMRVRGRPGPFACRGIPGPGILICRERTADYQITRGILEILDRDGNTGDLLLSLRIGTCLLTTVMPEVLPRS